MSFQNLKRQNVKEISMLKAELRHANADLAEVGSNDNAIKVVKNYLHAGDGKNFSSTRRALSLEKQDTNMTSEMNCIGRENNHQYKQNISDNASHMLVGAQKVNFNEDRLREADIRPKKLYREKTVLPDVVQGANTFHNPTGHKWEKIHSTMHSLDPELGVVVSSNHTKPCKPAQCVIVHLERSTKSLDCMNSVQSDLQNLSHNFNEGESLGKYLWAKRQFRASIRRDGVHVS